MKTSQKKITYSAALVCLILGLIVLLSNSLPSLIASLISETTQTPVQIESVDLKWGTLELQKLEIFNPPQAQQPKALSIEQITVEAPFSQYLSSPVVVDRLTLENIQVSIELYDKSRTQGNWQTLLQNMDQPDTRWRLLPHRVVHIHNISLKNISIELLLSGEPPYQIPSIPEITLEHIDAENGVPIQEITEVIMRHIIHTISLERGVKIVLKTPINLLKGLLSPLTGSIQKLNDHVQKQLASKEVEEIELGQPAIEE